MLDDAYTQGLQAQDAPTTLETIVETKMPARGAGMT
jgi:hypothetical protein